MVSGYSAWRGKGDSSRFFHFWLTGLKSDFPQRKNPPPFSRGSVFLKGRLNEKTESRREIEAQHGKQT